MGNYENAVFISYAWGGEREEVVNQIDQTLQQRGLKITRDKRDLGYKGSIKEFMEQIGKGNCVIVVVSDKYLRSPNCMFELVEIADNKQFHDRIFPIVLADANIYDPIKRIEYVKYWEEKRAELAKAIKTLDPANLQGIRDDMDLYDRIRDKISGLASTLKDMNTLTPEMHMEGNFNHLFDAIEKRMKESPTASPSETQKEPKSPRTQRIMSQQQTEALGLAEFILAVMLMEIL
jgi:internalin A